MSKRSTRKKPNKSKLKLKLAGVALLVLALITQQSVARMQDAQFNATVNQSILKIITPKGSGGTSFVVTAKSGQRVIITNAHICTDSPKGTLRLYDNYDHPLEEIKVLEIDYGSDLCILRAFPEDLPSLPVGKTVRKGEFLSVIGFPRLGPRHYEEGQVKDGEIAGVAFDRPTPKECKDSPELFLMTLLSNGSQCFKNIPETVTTLHIWPGNSGSPVFNADREVIGVMNLVNPATGEGLMIRLQDLQALLDKY